MYNKHNDPYEKRIFFCEIEVIAETMKNAYNKKMKPNNHHHIANDQKY